MRMINVVVFTGLLSSADPPCMGAGVVLTLFVPREMPAQ